MKIAPQSRTILITVFSTRDTGAWRVFFRCGEHASRLVALIFVSALPTAYGACIQHVGDTLQDRSLGLILISALFPSYGACFPSVETTRHARPFVLALLSALSVGDGACSPPVERKRQARSCLFQ